ncbi:hypothetical protein U879_06870 [Defluviimonas sp. 20V17]|uniref:Intracellular septation protein n=1 Tax=Allgaiera indica TaxID=765699 RepID=A0AAN5A1M3_9RHOB|nr:septation protein IspZ [Allgaiera indica]KDB04419.1 hypothetical protein U879_06870 [Defluviimonas sp. 20V17]GHE04574.1 intracellular septation protein [Allgaiera indica]SDX58043.1 Intracellular septation protein A [Allgaiera indica]
MKSFLRAVSLLLSDLASTFLFLAVLLASHDMPMAILSGMVLGVVQIVWLRRGGRRVETMQWLSLGLVLGSGGVALMTGDPRIVMLKPSLIYLIVGSVMLKRGWMLRYMPPGVQDLLGDVTVIFGYLWAGLMFFSAVLNVALALTLAPAHWALVMSVYGVASKLGLFLTHFAAMQIVGFSRGRRRALAARAASGAVSGDMPNPALRPQDRP